MSKIIGKLCCEITFELPSTGGKAAQEKLDVENDYS
jgi:hypothetical protein